MIERLRISTLCSRLRSLIGNFALLGWLRVLDQLADFRHAIFDLPIHEHFAQLQGTAARVALHTGGTQAELRRIDRKSTRLNSSHLVISYAVFCLKKKKK